MRPEIKAEHVGIIYSSLRASLSPRDVAYLKIGAVEDPQDEIMDELSSDVQITVQRKIQRKVGIPPQVLTRVLTFRTNQETIHLGAHVEDVEIEAPHAKVVIDRTIDASGATLVADIAIRCEELDIRAETVNIYGDETVVLLQASEYSGATMRVNHQGGELMCIWEGRHHPWTSYASEPVSNDDSDDGEIEEALRRFRHFVLEFRRHGRPRLGKSADKFDQDRMSKGTGKPVKEAMVKHGIITRDAKSNQYFLDPDRLADVTGVSYLDCKARREGPKARKFVREAIGGATGG